MASVDPYGSMSPDATFEVGGVERSITGLNTFLYGGDDGNTPSLNLIFDANLPFSFGRLATEFTLTVGTTVYNSTDAERYGDGNEYEWVPAPTWSSGDMVTVEIGFTEAVPFREGTTLEVEGAFTTPTMPRTLAFEAEMTVATGTSFDGYSSSQGSLSLGTFDVGGVQYTVDTVGFDTDDNEFAFHITPALPFDSFTLTLGATELLGASADFFVNNSGSGIYGWQEPNPNWASGATVDVKLDIGLIDICGRSQAVADAIVAATRSIDFCHMISRLDLYEITELDLTGKSGYGLKAGDFDGLPNLEILDMSGYSLGGH